MNSFTITGVQTFTITHAKYIASKVATDLKRMQRFYGQPNDADIIAYETELIELLKIGYLGTVKYGYKKNGNWIEPTLCYTAKEIGGLGFTNDDPGNLRPNANIDNAEFYSFLTYSPLWEKLSQNEKDTFKRTLPFFRGGAKEPGISGYLSKDKIYSSGGKAVERSSVKNY